MSPRVTPMLYGLQLDHGGSDVPAVEQELVGVVPRGFTYEFHVTSRVVTEVELAVKPESVALGGFGAIAALVCLVLGVQAISRQLRFGDEDRQVLRALGAGPAAAAGDGLIGLLGAWSSARSWPSAWRSGCHRCPRWGRCAPSTPRGDRL